MHLPQRQLRGLTLCSIFQGPRSGRGQRFHGTPSIPRLRRPHRPSQTRGQGVHPSSEEVKGRESDQI